MRPVLNIATFLLGAMALMSSCSSTKYVPEDSFLLNRVKIKATGEYSDINTATLRSYVRQRSNSRWFTLFRLPLATYSLSGRDTTKWINRTLKAMGEAPVIYDSLLAVRTSNDLTQQLRNEGFLNARVTALADRHKRKVDITYLIEPDEPYFIHHVNYVVQDSDIAKMLESEDASRRLIHEGMKFDVSKLDAERKRITRLLSDNGYYRFHKEYIRYMADSLPGTRLIDLTLLLSRNEGLDGTSSPHARYWIRHIEYGGEKDHLRPSVLRECTHLHEGEPYSGTGLENTYNHFGRMQAVKYTNITLRQVQGTDSMDCDIQLQMNKPSTISFQPEGTNTAGDLGAAASLTYENRNLFRGSEVLSVQLRGAYEAIRGLEGYSNQDFVEYSIETKLQFPRFISPFMNRRNSGKRKITSEVSLLYDMQNRPEFHRRLLSSAWRYKWASQDALSHYQFDVLDLNYVFMPWTSDTFRREYLNNDDNRNAILSYNYEDLFITKIGFGYSHKGKHTALKWNVETSGNLLSLGSRLLDAEKDGNGHYRLFNIAFAQYVKCDIDVSRSLDIDRNNQLVFHVGLGVAYPYGNSTVLPFEKRYFSGGANSVRGWNVRTLGPGKYKERDGRINFINQTGDMKLDLNAEYRTRLFWKFSGALFLDAGNVWTLRNYSSQAGGQFHFDDFAEQIAASYGLGLRLNFDYFILRFDLGMKAVNPAYDTEDDEHYPLLHPRFSRDYAFHFAVGMPF